MIAAQKAPNHDWLKDNLNLSDPKGYWTSTKYITSSSDKGKLAYYYKLKSDCIQSANCLGNGYIYQHDNKGVRPVITLSKSQVE